MKFLFSHRNFPGQFKNILIELGKDPTNEIVFITGTPNNINIRGVKKFVYKLKRQVPDNCHRYLRQYEESVNHGQSAAEIAIMLREQGFYPDVIYVHPWGNSLFLKDIFPKSKKICFCEWYYNVEGADIGFDRQIINDDIKAKTRCKNASLLLDLVDCEKGIAPTYWQKSQFPKEFQDKIEVLHDGVDTEYFTPDKDAVLKIPNSDIELTAKDKVVTYATRGMEPYRGFPEFMKMVESLLKKRSDVQVVIGGEDRVCYGARLANCTFKEYMLNSLDLDMSRVHFTGGLPYGEYKKLLQISSAHVYLTYPFVLSWSLMEAMSVGCCIVASKTPPVEEVIQDNKNGLLFDFYDLQEMQKQVEYALDNQDKVQELRNNARKTIQDNYALQDLLPKQIEILKSLGQL